MEVDVADRRNDNSLTVTSRPQGQAMVVTPVGDVDLTASPLLRQELKKVQGARPGRIIVDLGQVGYMDSSGLATLVEAMQQARKTGARIVLCALTSRVRSIIEIARLDSVFVIAGTVDESLTA
ncbi:MAG: STAS domain-containing protein [Pyrinomonadaceae bacterium]|nr:STAS domain-containing protein [Phycisphaerales bacterium]